MEVLNFLSAMKHSPITNYGGIPGLTSWLIGAPGPHGLIRLMECSRDHQEPIIPHSHRFDFHCIVLKGVVLNRIWTDVTTIDHGDEFRISFLDYAGAVGKYEKREGGRARYAFRTETYTEGEEYSMTAEQVHSIFFRRDTAVLFFEGPNVSSGSIILEPIVDGQTIPTFQVEPWAFKRGTPGIIA
jgi:hypothetical protein